MGENTVSNEVVYRIQAREPGEPWVFDPGLWQYDSSLTSQIQKAEQLVIAEAQRRRGRHADTEFRVVRRDITTTVVDEPLVAKMHATYKYLHDSVVWTCVHVYADGHAVLVGPKDGMLRVSPQELDSYYKLAD